MVISVNLVRIAIETKQYCEEHNIINNDEILSIYFKNLSKILDICKEGLLYRIHRLENVKASVAPILYGNSELGCYGATGQSLNPNDNIGKIFGKRTSISLGYVGLHETIISLFGEKLFKNDEMISYGKSIMLYLYDTTKKWSNETAYSFSVYGTPKFGQL